eukprot:GHVP01023792.1.p1 GENE.GHVP01023792.1~~GHVP01023792.1.p1  ORF type:complete len:283 (+),score=58.22 GHVP01023792.1:192-1040(+)
MVILIALASIGLSFAFSIPNLEIGGVYLNHTGIFENTGVGRISEKCAKVIPASKRNVVLEELGEWNNIEKSQIAILDGTNVLDIPVEMELENECGKVYAVKRRGSDNRPLFMTVDGKNYPLSGSVDLNSKSIWISKEFCSRVCEEECVEGSLAESNCSLEIEELHDNLNMTVLGVASSWKLGSRFCGAAFMPDTTDIAVAPTELWFSEEDIKVEKPCGKALTIESSSTKLSTQILFLAKNAGGRSKNYGIYLNQSQCVELCGKCPNFQLPLSCKLNVSPLEI